MRQNSKWITGKVRLSIDGQTLEMQMTVPIEKVKPQRMLPIFQKITDSFVEMGVRETEKDGEKISCRAGCGACCRQAVPIAEIEAYRIAELVEELPETQRREVKERFEKAVAHFEKIGWFEKLTAAVKKSKAEQEQVVLEYFHEGIPCPFLVNESCSIHPDRPLACREYLVTSPAENCANPTQQTIRTVKIPARPSKVVRKIGRTKNIGPDFLPLILSLKWVEGNTGNFPTKTGESWMADFFTNLTKSKIPRHNRK